MTPRPPTLISVYGVYSQRCRSSHRCSCCRCCSTGTSLLSVDACPDKRGVINRLSFHFPRMTGCWCSTSCEETHLSVSVVDGNMFTLSSYRIWGSLTRWFTISAAVTVCLLRSYSRRRRQVTPCLYLWGCKSNKVRGAQMESRRIWTDVDHSEASLYQLRQQTSILRTTTLSFTKNRNS